MRQISLTPDELKLVNDYNIGFVHVVEMPKAPKFATRAEEKEYVPGPGVHVCKIIDRVTNIEYIRAAGDDPETARKAAFALVPTTEKPKGKGPQATGIDPRDAKIAALEAQLASATAHVQIAAPAVSTPAAPKKKGGRPRKNPLPVETTGVATE